MRFYLGTNLPVLLAVMFTIAGAAKLLGAPGAIEEFAAIGIGQWFRYFTGVLEAGGAAALLFPRGVFWAAIELAVVMAGAAAASLTMLHVPEMAPLTAAPMTVAMTVA
jgi:putative oxidoreductase